MEFGISYFGCRFPEHFEYDLDELRDIGFTRILITYSENDFYFYHNTINKLVKAARKKNFKVYIDPWGVLGIFGGEAFSKFLLDNYHIWQTDNKNRKIPHACLTHKDTEKLLMKWLNKAAELDPDYMFWDEPHFYFKNFQKNTGIYGCFCDECRKKFFSQYNKNLPLTANSEFYEFRNSVILKLLKKLCSVTEKRGIQNNICLLPTENTRFGGLTDWNSVAEIKSSSIISTDPYWQRKNKDVKEYVGYYTEKLKNICLSNSKKSELWVQAYKIIKNRESEISDAVDVALKNKIDYVMFWSYKGGYPMSELESDDCKKTWTTIKNKIKKCL